MTIDWYEYTSGGGLQYLKWYEVQSDMTVGTVEVVFRDNGQIDTPDAPTIDTTTSILNSATSVTLNWTEPLTGPEVTGYEVYMDDVHIADTLPTVLTKTYTSVPNDGAVHKFTVAAQGSGGFRGAYSGALLLQWLGTPVPPPPAPTSLTRSNLQPTSVQLSWVTNQPAGGNPAIAHFRVEYGSGTVLKTGISPTVSTTSVTGLTENTTYTGVYVRAVDTTGAQSGPSNAITFTTPPVNPPPTATIYTGISSSDEDHFYTSWGAIRTYNTGSGPGDVTGINGTILALTDSGISKTGGAASATQLDNFLLSFYGKTGTPSLHPNIEVHWANGNEVDGDGAGYTSGVLPTAYINTVAAMRAVIDNYPMASMWVDMTQNNINNAGSGSRFEPIVPYLHGMACSMYAPGRKQQPTVYTPYANYAQAPLDTIVRWHGINPGCKWFSTWEWGIPIDHPSAWSDTVAGGEPTANTNLTTRPTYAQGFLDYCYSYLTARGITIRAQIYWDQQSGNGTANNPYGPPNQLWHDTGRVTPDTATVWHNWTP